MISRVHDPIFLFLPLLFNQKSYFSLVCFFILIILILNCGFGLAVV